MRNREIAVGMLGLGNVGGAVANLLHRDGDRLAAAVGAPLVLRRVLVRDPKRLRAGLAGLPCGVLDLVDDPAAILESPDIDLVIEVMGGLEPATGYMLRALRAGKPVVTANKEAVAYRGRELLETAALYGLPLRFEASVAGGVPIVRTLKRSLTGDRVLELTGIVNGTCNYVLGLMDEGCDRGQAVDMARQQGYAEADPSRDLNGGDAACKLAILCSIAFGSRVLPNQIWTEGITRVSPEDLRWGREMGYVLKLVAAARLVAGGLEAYVRPVFLPQTHPLATVRGVTNALLVRGLSCGELVFQGAGAGGEATATAVVADVVEAARHLLEGVAETNYCTCREEARLVPAEEWESAAYVHLEVVDRPGVLAAVAGCLAAHGVSAAEVLQKARGKGPVPILFITHPGPLGILQRAVADIERLPVVHRVCSVIGVVGTSW